MEIVNKKIEELIPYKNNSRTHSEEQIEQIVSSIKEFGFTNPILIDEDNNIIAGHGRLLGAKKLDMKEVPCIVLKNLTETQKKAYIIADNKMALNASWNDELLKLELESLKDLDFDLDLTGFNENEIDEILNPVTIDWSDVDDLSEQTYEEPGHNMLECPKCHHIDRDIHFKKIKSASGQNEEKRNENEDIS